MQGRHALVLTGLVAVYQHILLRSHHLAGQLPGLGHLVLGTYLIVLQIDGCIRGVIQLHP